MVRNGSNMMPVFPIPDVVLVALHFVTKDLEDFLLCRPKSMSISFTR
uniref:Uncharacterized protein n=1 Tax=Nelumbo nucifera TaxID=4432 RepID=A0A822YEW2_NELNU|nr:TPA_asm: hypothetical protein HUJ06_009911 [Nelumbo nucifera]